jgi:DNA-binding response OmpR family regulator
MGNDCRKILVVEDHQPTRRFLADNLTADGYELLEADCLSRARRLLAAVGADLVLLDLGLPDGDGLDLVTTLREEGHGGAGDRDLPLLVLSGRDTELDRLRGFERGCDDYLVKPFSYPELLARVRALLRRARRRGGEGRLRIGSLELDTVSRQVRLDGAPISLAKKEFALLSALASDPSRVFTREELLRDVWGYRTYLPTRTVDSHAYRLRGKLNRGGHRFVINVWGVGYRLIDAGGQQ